MEVKVTLVVARGKHAGREIPVPIPKFFIGRAEDCHLRIHSELVSRHHCVLIIEEGFVAVRDFQSKNGTFVNGERVTPQVELKPGDVLQVGPMELEVRAEVLAAGKKTKVAAQGEKAATGATPAAGPDDTGFHLGSQLGVAGQEVSSDDDTVTMCPTDLAKAFASSSGGQSPSAETGQKKAKDAGAS